MAAQSLGSLPLVVIVGPTASGKTSLAIELARQFGGEIICADSRTVYKGMDIGTAKPSLKDRAEIPHWGLDLVEPGARFTVADFKDYATKKIHEIRSKGKVPFLVGGSGLYVDAVIFDYQFGIQRNERLRTELSTFSIEELQEYCLKNNIELPENKKNRRHLILAIERNNMVNAKRNRPINNTIIVGITTDRQVLKSRIESRIEQLFDDGVVEEATLLGKKYGWKSEAMTGNIYPLIRAYLEGELTIEETKIKAATLDRRLAKRQMTWFRRNGFIKWYSLSDAAQYLKGVLANE